MSCFASLMFAYMPKAKTLLSALQQTMTEKLNYGNRLQCLDYVLLIENV